MPYNSCKNFTAQLYKSNLANKFNVNFYAKIYRRKQTYSGDQKRIIKARLVIFNPEDIQINKPLGTVGVLNIQSYDYQQRQFQEDLSLSDIQKSGQQVIEQTGIECRLYTGVIVNGQYEGTNIILKSYPSTPLQELEGSEADALAANEINAHAIVQPPVSFKFCPQIVILLGGFETTKGISAGEKFLVYLNEGTLTLDQYAQLASEAGNKNRSVSTTKKDDLRLDLWSSERILQRRKQFIKRIMKEILNGLTFMHQRKLLHQSLGPRSVVLSSGNERDWTEIKVKLQDLAFAVDVSDEALFGGLTLGEIWDANQKIQQKKIRSQSFQDLWRRATEAGASTDIQRRNFGYVDDTYSAGMLFAYIVFVSLSEPGSIDGMSLRKLIQNTFMLDLIGFKEYCQADDRWHRAVQFLDEENGQGWDLLQNMLNADWKLRPTSQACLNHPFFGKRQDNGNVEQNRDVNV
eukprot:TRINITY_DN3965_c0_g2_i3.p1 TRINITY_DN3965_c0_g2~~TRINITY_DN3965_c0_g2_i3.p1  ORF type:complete len:490 (+),score=50.54 TRINITY_DN3965_c0_g2_i3:85-1470(+)